VGNIVNEVEKNWFFKLCNILEKITLYTTMTICATMLIVAWVHVIRRYVFNNSLTWSEEFLRFSLVWFALLSASIIHKKRGHLGIVTFREMMPKKIQNFFERSIPYLALVATLLTAIYGVDLMIRVQGQFSPALRIPVALPYAAIPVSFFLMSIYGVAHIIEDFKVASKEKNN
jgi:TRAP-type C4-dicarboxylate transport system permease small subunit